MQPTHSLAEEHAHRPVHRTALCQAALKEARLSLLKVFFFLVFMEVAKVSHHL